MPFSRAPVPLAIPNARFDLAPPPLPPPRNTDITAGSDPGWAWGNDPKGGNFGKARESLRPISNFPKSWGKNMEEDRPLDPPEFRRRESSTSTVRSPAETSRGFDFARHQDEGYYSLSGPRPSAMSQQLHGERQLQQKNFENSSQAYDNKLLSKIGKPKTPPRNASLGSIESSPTSNLSFHQQQQQQQSGRHPNQLRSLSFPHSSYSNSAYSDPPIKKEPSSGYGDSPRSRPVSPGLNLSTTSAHSSMDWRSPPSSAHDSDQQPYYPQRFPSSTNVLRQQKSRRSTSGSLLSSYDESAGNSMNYTASTVSERPSPLKRESYDQPNFFEPDSADPTFPMEDSVRKLRLEDRPPLISSNPDSLSYYYKHSNPSLHTSRSRPGMKRKPSQSPPPDPAHEANASFAAVGGNNTDLHQRNTSTPQHPSHRVSPLGRQFAQNQGSFSSQSSTGPRNNSYASSAGLSVASSITTLDQHSPGISPSSDQQQQQQQQQLLYQQHSGQDSPYVTSLPMNQAPRNTRDTRPQQQYSQAPLETHPTPPVDQKPQNPQNQRKNNAPPNMQPPSFICGCCPKKPKKFDTLEELRVHESEKQYSCMYCPNRFKNKNEAERHQNSLHLRKHSWSCATLNNSFDSAFYPSTNIPPADNSSSPSQPPPPPTSLTPFDTCGYCGQQFPNEPAPDWEARGAHLNGVHKFGECNQSKKFFRADHFRQHLKHSHAGTSGKWTNMLETACMRDEPPPTPQDNNAPQSQGAPVANMGMGPTNMGPGNMGQGNMGQDMGQNMGQANMGQGPMGQANMGQVNMGQDGMGQGEMGQGGMGQNMVQPKYEPLDMSNIDPNIGMQQMGNMGPMPNMGTMGAAPARGMGMQGGQMRSERIDEMPQEM
ncbi:hypothetical protein HO133_010596 [Letharia lupina]|uniref:C2H2-type domain-containing protein n=1 Tax=Letharia lupina TaxID=560253 RepID=A0A8H6CID9_9LECA|nr:uncharacterized protein HO133_010596 [Letharia lupina]KAF6224022.1 hypothetical protein HO133_010596 [Letharia lupina]